MTKSKICRRCSKLYIAWRCPYCYRGSRSGGGSRSTFARRGGAASVLAMDWREFDAPGVNIDAVPMSDAKFAALVAEDDAGRVAADDEAAYSRGLG